MNTIQLPLTSAHLVVVVGAALLGLGLGACGSQSLGAEDSKPDPDPEIQPGPEKLDVFESCDDLLAETKARATAALDMYSDYWGFYFHGEHRDPDSGGHELRVPTTEVELHAKGGVPVQVGVGEGAEHSETNVWEAGVDEMAVMKTDGERLLALASAAEGMRLHYVDVSGASPQLRGSVELGTSFFERGLILHEDRALVLIEKCYGCGFDVPSADVKEGFGLDFAVDISGFVLELVEVDISDPDDLKILRRLHMIGDLAGARMVEGVVRVVLHSFPSGLAMKLPDEFLGLDGDYEAAQAQAREYNKTVVDASTLGNWLPRYVLEDMSQETKKVSHGLLMGCEQVLAPGASAGLMMTSVLALDVNAGLGVGKNVGLFSDVGAVAATSDSLYMTTRPWTDETQGQTTYVHKFDIQGAERAKYVASGEVHGWNRYMWSLSEWKGDLRVLSTDDVESFVSVLRQEGDALVQVGQVGGLAPLNSLQGVRFVGETGYVAVGEEWFNQLRAKLEGPATRLTVVDLSEPTQPTVVGELPEIPGILEYLHPVGEGLLLGIGNNNDPEVRQLRLSLFDVADKAAPKLLHMVGTDAYTDIGHEDFLWWEKTGLAMLPADIWEPEQGAQGFHVDAEAGISSIGAVHHAQDCGSECGRFRVQQAQVVGELVYTLSDVGLKASVLSDLSDKHWLEFPQ